MKDVQSRREFFKSAAKAVLPIIGAVVLSNLPLQSKAATSCNGGCMGTCEGRCTGCYGTCAGSCSGSCARTCYSQAAEG